MKEKKISAKLEKLAVKNNYFYMQEKAKNYLEKGAEKYRKDDAFGMPPKEWEKEYGKKIWKVLEDGCKQIQEFKGLTADNPFTRLNIAGFYRLIELLHYKSAGHRSRRMPDGNFIDEMKIMHTVTGEISVLFNQTA